MIYYAILCYAMLYYAMLCYAMPYYAMLCYTILHYTTLYYTDSMLIVACLTFPRPSRMVPLPADPTHWSICLTVRRTPHSPHFIRWFYCHFKQPTFHNFTWNKACIVFSKYKQGIWRSVPSWFQLNCWNVGCWNDSKASAWIVHTT